MVSGLRSLGVGIEEIQTIVDGIEELQWKVTPATLRGNTSIDVGNAGTVMRFLPPFAALAQGDISFDGDPRSHERPLGPVIKALEELGISISHDGRYSLVEN
jgi:3-phosphoshikimate 1-carboxyvinyltransferase